MSRLFNLPQMTTLPFTSDSIRCLAVVLVLLAACTDLYAQTPEGFLNIDCGYNGTPYFDNVTTLLWASDGTYILTGTDAGVDLVVDPAIDNSQALQTFRSFPDMRTKHCYELPNTYDGSNFLVRAMFLHANSPILPLPLMLNVSVGVTNWFSVRYDPYDSVDTLNTPKVFESIFNTSEKFVHVCLLQVTGIPFISSLELRPVTTTSSDEEHFLWPVLRLNPGAKFGTQTVRYPNDPSDRLWHPPDVADSSIPSIRISSVDSADKIFLDAWLNDTANSSFATSNYTIFYDGFDDRNVLGGFATFWIYDISPNANSSTVRGMSVTVNEENYLAFNVTTKSYFLVPLERINLTPGTLDFTFSGLHWSALGPIVNGIEVFAEVSYQKSTTIQTDVVALQGLQESFNLTDWQGDPCLPVAWNWVTCETDSITFSASVTKLLLSSWGIKGSIPSSIVQLDALTEIRLDNNSLSGSIPDSFADLQLLTVLLLNNNNLSGEVPAKLLNKTGLLFNYSGNSLLQISSTSRNKKESNVGVIVGATVGALFIFLGVLTVMTWYFWYRKPKKLAATSDLHSPTKHHRLNAAGNIPLDLILEATNNYAQKIGTGSYGSVYYGVLRGKEVAVKVNNIHSNERNLEFINEVDILTRVHHKNLVNLIGFCEEGQQFILIYEFQANGTLREWLSDAHTYEDATSKEVTKFLNWPKRLQIAVNAAEGLEYLHKDCTPTIIHRDVKTSNILLGDNLVGKVADFGISKTALDETQDSSTSFLTSVKGTNGYLDPEYFGTSILTQKSDVYSFGVVLAELISGQLPVTDLGNGNYSILVDKLQGCVERADLQSFADPRLKGDYDEECLWRVADIALSCVARNRDERPFMSEVARDLEMLKGRAWETDSSIREISGLPEIPNKVR